MPEDKFGEAQPIGKSAPELAAWSASDGSSAGAGAPTELTAGDANVPPPPPTFQYESPSPGSAPPLVSSTERNWLARVSMIFAFFGPGLLGIGLGIAGLNAAKQGRATNKTLAKWAIVLNGVFLACWIAFWISIMSSSSAPPQSSGLDDTGFDATVSDDGDFDSAPAYTEFENLRVGDCIEQPDLNADVTSGLLVVNCGIPHWGQLYEIDSLPAGDFPGDDEAATLVGEACGSDEAIGNLVSDIPVDLFIWYYWPSESSWLDGDRSYDCLVYSNDGPLQQSYVD